MNHTHTFSQARTHRAEENKCNHIDRPTDLDGKDVYVYMYVYTVL